MKKAIRFNENAIVDQKHWIECIAFSSDETCISYCSAEIVTVLDIERNTSFELHHDAIVWKCAFINNDEEIISIGSNGCLFRWESNKRCLISATKLHSKMVFGLSVHPYKPITATSGSDGNIVCYNYALDTVTTTLRAHSDSVEDVIFSFCGQYLASCSKDKSVLLWNNYLDDNKVSAVSFTGHTNYVTKCAFSFDNNLLATVSYDRKIGVWSIEDRCLLYFLRRHTNIIWGCVFLSNGKLVTCSSDKSIRVWMPEVRRRAVESHACLGGVSDGNAQILSCAHAPFSKRLAVSTFGGKIFLADVIK